MPSYAIVVHDVSKYYSFSGMQQLVSRNPHRDDTDPSRFDETKGFAALQGVSFTVAEGTATALIGKNGAGKTTMLRILSGVSRPSEGFVTLAGHAATLLSLRAGINPRLTGRENIYIYGALMGFDKRQIEARLEEIVNFAELGTFIDMPLASYSPGMSVRLAFSTSVHLEADILLIDEILAVGDLSFQTRALERMKRYFEGGYTVVFSSHNISAIQKLCSNVVWLHEGRIRQQGTTEEVLPEYQRFCSKETRSSVRAKKSLEGPAQDQDAIETYNALGQGRRRFSIGETIDVRLRYRDLAVNRGSFLRLSLFDHTLARVVYQLDSRKVLAGDLLPRSAELRCLLEGLELRPRPYWIEITLHDTEVRSQTPEGSAETDEQGALVGRISVVIFDPAEIEAADQGAGPLDGRGHMTIVSTA